MAEETPEKNASAWAPLDFDGLYERLSRAKALLEQAAALGAVKEAGRLERMGELGLSKNEEHALGERGRRYR
ncbi:hypothetical protein [Sorangium sp. So ce341]|uniref:hypothetical protein n=1 Tax=Sorangium sp. So ce341 TaxID=3133302 RepID=UPI003F63E7B4